jgi:exodeoxyribonuclease VII large subunit
MVRTADPTRNTADGCWFRGMANQDASRYNGLMEPISVTQLTVELKELIESNFSDVAVVGEISNFSRASSGHCYFTLKDDRSQIRAVMWKTKADRLRFDIHDGLEVVVVGPVGIYEARGTYQITCEQMIPQGLGPLELAFRQLHEKLSRLGYFDTERKRPLPFLPRRIALVTSPTGAAVRDMLQVMTRRWPKLNLVIVPVPVQGDGASHHIAAGIRAAAHIPDVDIIITGRGGGSLEDLFCFNEEPVAKAIFESPIPVISAVGHEIDVTIADLVADRRALTPSEAAEIVTPKYDDLLMLLEGARSQLANALRTRAHRARAALDALASRRCLTHPTSRIKELAERVDDWEARLLRAYKSRLQTSQHQVATLATQLEHLSPLKTLARGYSLTTTDDGHLISMIDDIQQGQPLQTRVQNGVIHSTVTSIESTGVQ